MSASRRRSLFQLQLAVRLVFLKELPEIFRRIKQPDPLFIIECDGKASEAVNAHASLFPDSKIQRSRSSTSRLFLQFGKLRFQLFIGWFCHWIGPPQFRSLSSIDIEINAPSARRTQQGGPL